MKILKYIASLLPSFDRQRIINNITTLQQDLSGSLLKLYAEVGAVFSKKKFQSQTNVDFDALFHSRIPGNKSVNFISGIETILKTLPAKLGFLETMVANDYSHDVARDGLTYKKAAVLKYLEVTEFVVTYAGRLLLSTMAIETCHINGTPELLLASSPPAMVKWMETNKTSFLAALAVLAQSVEETKEQLDSIPDVTAVPENAEMHQQTLGASKIDPMGLGFLITTWANPIYHLRLAFSEWQVERYKAKQELKRALEFRLLALQEAYDKKQDPKLQTTIQYTEGRLAGLNRKLSELESEYTA